MQHTSSSRAAQDADVQEAMQSDEGFGRVRVDFGRQLDVVLHFCLQARCHMEYSIYLIKKVNTSVMELLHQRQ